LHHGRSSLRSLAALTLLVTTAGCSGTLVSETDVAADAAAPPLQSVEFQISGMNCEGCERSIERAVAQLEGVIEVEAFQEDARVVVTIDPALVTPRTIESQIERLGHEAVLYTGTTGELTTSAKTF